MATMMSGCDALPPPLNAFALVGLTTFFEGARPSEARFEEVDGEPPAKRAKV